MHCLMNIWRSSVSLVSFGRALQVDAPTKLKHLHPKEVLAVGRLIWRVQEDRVKWRDKEEWNMVLR